jgi:hypothetical protein
MGSDSKSFGWSFDYLLLLLSRTGSNSSRRLGCISCVLKPPPAPVSWRRQRCSFARRFGESCEAVVLSLGFIQHLRLMPSWNNCGKNLHPSAVLIRCNAPPLLGASPKRISRPVALFQHRAASQAQIEGCKRAENPFERVRESLSSSRLSSTASEDCSASELARSCRGASEVLYSSQSLCIAR